MTLPEATMRALLPVLMLGSAAAQTQAPVVHPAAPTPITIAKPILPYSLKPRPRARLPQAPYNPNLIALDPAHGGPEPGAHLGSAGEEKDLNLAFANRLKTMLEAQQFTVVLTRATAEDDPAPDQRAETMDRSRPLACLLLHATNAGHGVHLFASALTAPFFNGDAAQDTSITPWDSAQAPNLAQSLQLANELATAMNGMHVPLVITRASVRPIDSLTCAAVAIEIAPSAAADASVADETYQQRVAQALVTALGYWRDHAKAQLAAVQAAALAANPTAIPAPAMAAKPKPKPKPIVVPDESPLAPEAAPRRPAPIERRPPPPTNPPTGGQR